MIRIVKVICAFFLLFSSFAIQSQILINTGIDLNSGGKVNDVEYNPHHKGYFVVGSFTSPTNNLFFVNEDDFTLNSSPILNPILSVDGEIWCVEMIRTYNWFCDCYTYHLYLGGNFSTIQTGSGIYSRNGIVKLSATHPSSWDPFSMAAFDVDPWDADIDMTPLWEDGVYDIDIFDDTLIFTGQFLAVNQSTTYDVKDGFAAYNYMSETLLPYPSLAPSAFIQRKITNYQKLSDASYISLTDRYTLGNQGKVWKLDPSGDIDPSFTFPMSSFQCGHRLREMDDSLLFAIYDANSLTNGADDYIIVRKSDGSEKFDHELSEDGLEVIGGVCCGKYSQDIYKNYLFLSSGGAGFGLVSFEHLPGTGPVGTPNWNANTDDLLNPSHWGHLFIEENLLFTSAANMSTLSGQPKVGFGIYCLEPPDPTTFFTADSTVCPGQIVTYTIPAVDFCEGYEWSYTGTGADLNLTGAPENLFQIMPGSSGNTIVVEYTDIFTPGQLQVRAYTTCNDNLITSDTLFSKPLIANIASNPIPNANAGPDTSISCAVDSVLLVGSSTTSGCTFEWINTGPYGNTLGTDSLAFVDGEFIFKVTSPLGCPNFDTVYVVMDTIKPDVILPVGPYELTCADTNFLLLGSTSITDTLTYWKNVGSGFTFPNPISVNSPGNYRYIVVDTGNGCADSSELIMTLNQPAPNITVLGYPALVPGESLDTITCFADTLNLTCSSDSSNVVANWTLADTSSLFGNNQDFTSAGIYYIYVQDTLTGCENFTALTISEFTTPPNVLLPDPQTLNCSIDSIVLSGSSTILSVNYEWTGSSISPSLNPVTIETGGWYYLEVSRLDNGCSMVDSVFVTQDSSINLITVGDTLVCDQSSFDLGVSFEGTLSGVSYLWNNGSTLATANYTGGNDSTAITEVFADGGCYGSDTIAIFTPDPVQAELNSFQPCGDPSSGQIVAIPTGGLPPFEFSIDYGTSIQSSSVFGGLSIGPYTITIYDSLQCAYEFDAIIDQGSALPEPEFLFSTYNFISDTIVIVDVSNPPADSVVWLIPFPIEIIDSNMISPTIILPDTGEFTIGLESYYGDCQILTEKFISAAVFDTSHATASNSNGIKSIELFPNPSSGSFTFIVEFYKKQNAHCAIQSSDGVIIDYFEYQKVDLIEQTYSMDLVWTNGSYVFKVISEFDSGAVIFILSR